jgi:hypothetical protein
MKCGEEEIMSDPKEDHLEVNLDEAANKDSEPSVEVSDEPVAEVAPEKPIVAEEDPVKALAELRSQLERERRARIEAETRARQASTEADDTNLQLVTGAIETMQREQGILKGQLKEAMSVGDFDRAAELQEAMSNNAAKLLQLENGREAMKVRPRSEPVQRHSDPVEQFAAQLSPRSADWVRKNPQFVTDPRLNQKMIAAHNLAVADGHVPDSDGYFSAIEDTLRVRRVEPAQNESTAESPLSSAAKPVARAAPPAAAPVNRGSNGRSNIVRLTRAEADTAKMLGMTETEYAKHKLALQKEGKLPN